MRIGRLPLAAALLTVSCGGLAPQDPPAEKPNFVVLLADDLGWTDLGCYGSDLYETPHLDRLAADGMRFTHGYAACTVCSPTRAAILTGMYPGRTHVTDFITGGVRPKAKLRIPDWTMQLDHRHTSLAEALGAAGYRTAHVGKWHLMPRNEPDVMMDFTPEKHGFEINIGGNEWGAPGSYFHPYANARRKVTRLPAGGADGDYLTDRLTDEALKILDDFVAESSGRRVPFSWSTWITWTPSSTNDATRAMIVPFAVAKAATPPAPPSARVPPAPSSVRLPSGCRVPPSCTRISCTPSSGAEAARANTVPLGARNASTALALASASVPASSSIR